jgi:hypothetical protein
MCASGSGRGERGAPPAKLVDIAAKALAISLLEAFVPGRTLETGTTTLVALPDEQTRHRAFEAVESL